ncbi:MAG TPA: AbrB/MazE/SpoVT family DNA-binding domain-containing protein [Fluviicoccus sp.]|nr:AbrB/MazE/SpoVT family DNA-binding domain-containing protein [Fluviicoccus sp.]
MTTLTSRVFMNGNSQAVRIPQEFRLDTRHVRISRTESGDLLIHPVPEQRGTAILNALQGLRDALGDELLDELEQELRQPDPPQEREPL